MSPSVPYRNRVGGWHHGVPAGTRETDGRRDSVGGRRLGDQSEGNSKASDTSAESSFHRKDRRAQNADLGFEAPLLSSTRLPSV